METASNRCGLRQHVVRIAASGDVGKEGHEPLHTQVTV
jgi:hypothetical protein